MGSLGRIATMVRWTVRRTFRSPSDLVWLVLMPVGLGLVISYVLTGIVTVRPPEAVVVNEDGTAAAERLIDALERTPFQVHLASRDQVMEQLAQGELERALVVPDGFAQSVEAGAPQLEVLRAGGASEGLLAPRAKAIAAAMARGAALPGAWIQHETPRGTVADDSFPRLRIVFGVYLLFALTALINRATALHRERKAGLLQRTLEMGIPHGEVIIASAVSLILVGLLQAAVVLAITGALGVPWLAAGGTAIAVAVLGHLVASSGLAMALAGFARTEGQLQLFAGGAPSLLAMLGGAFMPLELAPASIQKAAVLNPFYWAMEALDGGFVYQGWASQAGPLAVLILVGVVGTVVGVQGFRRRVVAEGR